MKKISMIITVYNRLEFLRTGLICLLNQTVKPYELIISDDGSSESVMEAIGDLIDRADFKIKHISHKDLGFRKSRTLNNAIRNAEGEILVFCDQDIIFPKDHLETIVKNLKENEFLNYMPITITETEKEIFVKKLNETYDYNDILKYIKKNFKENEVEQLKKARTRRWLNNLKLNKRGVKLVGMSHALYKKNFIKVNGYNEKYVGWGYEDSDFSNRLYSLGMKGREIKDENISLHLWHPEDTSKKGSQNKELYGIERKKALRYRNFTCEYGYNNSLDKDEVVINILKN